MASISERRNSRVGATRGLDGVSFARTFDVHIDQPSDDPAIPLLKEHPLGELAPVEFKGARGSDEHWNFAAIVSGTRIVERLTSVWYVVNLLYKPIVTTLANSGLADGWVITGRTGSETIEVFDTLSLEQLHPSHVGQVPPPHLLGTEVYIESDSDTGFATIKVTETESQQIKLAPTGARKGESIIDESPSMMVQLDASIPDFNLANIGILGAAKGRINVDTFLSAPPGFMKVVGASATPLPPNGAGLAVPYAVSILFSWSNTQWSPLRRVPVFESEGGAQSVVFDSNSTNGDAVIEEWYYKLEADFGALVALIGTPDTSQAGQVSGGIRS